jgi:hypothetical protein
MVAGRKEIVIKEFEALREIGSERLRVRVVRAGERISVDVRQYVDQPDFVGFTRRGLRLSSEEFAALLEQGPAIQRLLDRPETPRRELSQQKRSASEGSVELR